MRSVSSAICTFVLPVSASLAPNWAVISRLRSLVIAAIRPGTVADGWRPIAAPARPSASRDELARAPYVVVHLGHQRVGRVEAALAAQPLQELQRQLLAVEVALE